MKKKSVKPKSSEEKKEYSPLDTKEGRKRWLLLIETLLEFKKKKRGQPKDKYCYIDDEMNLAIAELVKKGLISEEDIVYGHSQEVLDFSDIIEIKTHLNINQITKMSFHEARDLASKYHFMLLSLITKKIEAGAPKNDQEIQETFRAYEKMIDDIHEGRIEQEKIDFLKTMPPTSDWDHHLAVKRFAESPWAK